MNESVNREIDSGGRFGGALGEEFARVEGMIRRSSVQRSPNMRVSHTSAGVLLEPRVGDGSAIPAESSEDAVTVSFASYTSTGFLKGVDQSWGKALFCGTAFKGVFQYDWIGPPISEHLFGSILTDASVGGATQVGTAHNVGHYPKNYLPSGFGGGAGPVVKGDWKLSFPYPNGGVITLLRLDLPVVFNLADDGEPADEFVAYYIDANLEGRVWERSP